MTPAQSLRGAQLGVLQRSLTVTAQIARSLGRATKLPQHLLTGARGEDEALFYLRRKGFVIVAQQWKSAMYPGDLDLVAWDGDCCLCVVEVKTRTSRSELFTAEGAVDTQKRRALRRLAGAYLRRLPKQPAAKRFDVVAVYLNGENVTEFEHLPGAFPWSE